MRSSIVLSLLIIFGVSCAGTGYDVRLKNAESLMSRGAHDAAFSEIASLIKNYPDKAGPYALLGAIQYRRTAYTECLSSFETAENKGYTGDFRFYAKKGIALYHTGDIINAEKELKRSASMRTSPDAQKYLGLIMYSQKRYSGAAVFLEETLKTFADDISLLYPLGDALLHCGRITDAAEILNRASDADPGNSALAFVTANTLVKDGRFHDAITRYTSIPIDHDTYPESRYNAGKLSIELGNYQDAIKHLTSFLEHCPGHEDAMISLASALIATGQYREAIIQTETIIEKNADNPSAQFNHGLALYNLGAHDQAIVHLSHTVSLNPDDIKSRYTLALTLTETGDIETAHEHISVILGLKANHTGALMWMEYYNEK